MNRPESACKICTRLRKDKKMDLSVCIITKNENKKLKRCLKSLAFLEADIVVVDTGFNDETKKLVTELNGRYFTFEWCDDFSAARNYSLEQARYDDILVLDSDEWLAKEEEVFNKAALESFMRRDLQTLACCYIVDVDPKNGVGASRSLVSRVFSKKYYRYEGQAHEQPVIQVKKSGSRVINLDLKIYHDGYADAKVVKGKAKRNLELLLKNLETEPDKLYLLFQVGMSYLALNNYEQALEYLERTVSHREFHYNYPYSYSACAGYLRTLLVLEKKELVLEKITYFTKKFPNLADFWYDSGEIYLKLDKLEEAITSFKRATKCTQAEVNDKNDNLPYYKLGQLYAYLGDIKQAKSYYEKCQPSFELAQKELVTLRKEELKRLVTIYILDYFNDAEILKLTLASLKELPFGKIVVSQRKYSENDLTDYEVVQLTPAVFAEYLKVATNYGLLIHSGERLVDFDLNQLKELLTSKKALSGYSLISSPNQIKALGYRSYYHELRLVGGVSHDFYAGLLHPNAEAEEELIPLTIESPLEVRASLGFETTASAYANLLFMQGNYQAALDHYQAYFMACDYDLEESLHSAANAILTSVFLGQFDWLAAYLPQWSHYYQNFAIYQFSLGYYFKALGEDEQAEQAFTEAKRLANSLNPLINAENLGALYNAR